MLLAKTDARNPLWLSNCKPRLRRKDPTIIFVALANVPSASLPICLSYFRTIFTSFVYPACMRDGQLNRVYSTLLVMPAALAVFAKPTSRSGFILCDQKICPHIMSWFARFLTHDLMISLPLIYFLCKSNVTFICEHNWWTLRERVHSLGSQFSLVHDASVIQWLKRVFFFLCRGEQINICLFSGPFSVVEL